MKKLESSLKNMLLVLTGVTAISVALLAYVNELTKEPIAEANAKTLNEALKKVLPEFNEDIVPDTIFSEKGGKQVVDFILYPAMNNGAWVGTAVQATSMGFGGELAVLVGFDAEGKIFGYSLLKHAETPGLGSKADVWFQKGQKGDIIGRSAENGLTVSKDGGEIDAITASTITSRAFLQAINRAYQAYQGNQVDTTSGATPQKNVEQVADSVAVQAVDSLGTK